MVRSIAVHVLVNVAVAGVGCGVHRAFALLEAGWRGLRGIPFIAAQSSVVLRGRRQLARVGVSRGTVAVDGVFGLALIGKGVGGLGGVFDLFDLDLGFCCGRHFECGDSRVCSRDFDVCCCRVGCVSLLEIGSLLKGRRGLEDCVDVIGGRSSLSYQESSDMHHNLNLDSLEHSLRL